MFWEEREGIDGKKRKEAEVCTGKWRGGGVTRVTRSGSQVWVEGYVTFESPLSALSPDESCAWALINGGFRLDQRLPHRLIHARHWIRFELDSSQLAMPSNSINSSLDYPVVGGRLFNRKKLQALESSGRVNAHGL